MLTQCSPSFRRLGHVSPSSLLRVVCIFPRVIKAHETRRRFARNILVKPLRPSLGPSLGPQSLPSTCRREDSRRGAVISSPASLAPQQSLSLEKVKRKKGSKLSNASCGLCEHHILFTTCCSGDLSFWSTGLDEMHENR